MRKLAVFVTILMLSVCDANAQGILNKVKVYFNHPVDNSFSTTGISAKYIKNELLDTIAAYINRAKYTVDIAQYDYSAYSTDTVANIANAVNSAYKRGVKVRWLHDSTASNVGLSLLSKGIPYYGSPPTGGIYNIMHNKFVIIDVWDSTRAIVADGSADWSGEMNDFDYNNQIFVQSKVLARAFTNEFNIMWGDTIHGGGPNKTNSKFGTTKPNSGTHKFTIAGSEFELYFSPSDTCNTHVIKTIDAAKTDMYCSMYDFTQSAYSTPFVNQGKAGIYTGCILDQYSSGTTAYTALSATTNFAEYTGTEIYHNKFITIDPSNPCGNPMVLTGSMNWTAAGYDQNDENIIIIHNDTIANLYLQSFAKDLEVIGSKTLVKQSGKGCTVGLNAINSSSGIEVYPNPFNGSTTIDITTLNDESVTAEVYNIMGQKVATLVDGVMMESGKHTVTFTSSVAGMYLLRVQEGQNFYVKKLISANR